MYKTKKLWTPLSTILVRTTLLPSISRFPLHYYYYYYSTSQYSNSNTYSSSLNIGHNYHLENLKFDGRRRISFCSQSSPPEKCWNCNTVAEATPFLFCHSCRCIQPVDTSVDYFQIFGLEKKYEIEDDVNLERKYKDWQKKLHPDLVHSKSKKEREYAAEQSARVIDAYRTLSEPLSRAIYILKLEGVHVDQEETISEPELLAEIMEIREAVEEAPDSQALDQIQSQMQEKLKLWSNSFANAFQSRKFEEAVDSIRRMTYYDRVNEEIVKRL